MRRTDRQQSEAFALSVLHQSQYATLSMASRDGSPYAIPISIVCEDRSIYFHCAMEGKKVELLRENPTVCISCVAQAEAASDSFTMYYQSAIAFGIAKEVILPDEKIHALRLLSQRFTSNNMKNFSEAIEQSLSHTSVWVVPIEQISGKSNSAPTRK